MSNGKYILAALDGTESWKYKNSHVLNFFLDFQGDGHTWYVPGPELSGSGAITKYIDITGEIVKATDFLGTGTKICLVGHSRGGLIAINVARELAKFGLKVYFLGLYDAVDRALILEGDYITNVEYTYHAIRSSSMLSRSWMSNTGRCQIGGDYSEQDFMTSHGGIGGDYKFDDENSSFFSDNSCTQGGMTSIIWEAFGDSPNMEDLCYAGSRNADAFIRAGAKKEELPISIK